MKKNLNISLIQSCLFWENVDKNLSHFEELISKISGTDIILLPEMFNTAFCPISNHLAETMKDKTVIMDFITDQSENVYPMISAGAGHNEMVLKPSDSGAKPLERELA